MKTTKILWFIIIMVSSILQMQGQLAFLPNNEDMKNYMDGMQAMHPTILKVEELGVAENNSAKKIWGIKISDNVNATEDEPVWVFTGIIHGREKLGMRIAINLIEELTSGYGTNTDITNWIDNYEIWFIPNMNPNGADVSWNGNRKNGAPSSQAGVDLNRNWGFRHDQAGSGTNDPNNSRYRGPNEFSENETSAIRDLYIDRKPVFGLTFHSGNEPDGGQILRPWSTNSGIAGPPDVDTIDEMAEFLRDRVFVSRMAGDLCQDIGGGNFQLQDPDGQDCSSATQSGFCRQLCWEPTLGRLGAYGQSSNWCYAAVGTHDYTIELTDKNFKHEFMFTGAPPVTATEINHLAIAQEISKNWEDAIKDWFNDFLFNPTTQKFKGPGITGHVTNAMGDPVVANVKVMGRENSLTEDRFSDAGFGRFWRLLPVGTYSLQISADGYDTMTKSVTVANGELTEIDCILSSTLSTETFNRDKDFYAYPNPSNSGIINVHIPNPKLHLYTLTMVGIDGKKVKEISTLRTNLNIDVQDLSAGIYILNVNTEDNRQFTKKIILK